MRSWLAFFLALSLALSFAPRTGAHTYVTDGTITVLLHTNPDDDPIAGEPAAMLFEVTDSTKKFQAENCACRVAVANSGQTLLDTELLRISGASVYAFTMPLTFPQRAVYHIVVTGQPHTAGQFQSFKVEYDLRVDRQGAVAAKTRGFWGKLGLIVLAGIFVSGLIFMRRKYAKK